MSDYRDLFLRQTLSEASPNHFGGPASPDVIPAGTNPVDPKVFVETYGQDLGQAVVSDKSNFIYVRSRNAADESKLGRLFACAAPETLLAWPDELIPLKTQDGRSYLELTVPPQAVGVSSGPFVYNPGDKGVQLAAYVITREHPVELPKLSSIVELSEFFHTTPAYAQRSVAFGFPDAAPYRFLGAFQQRDVQARMMFSIRCINCAGFSVGLLPQSGDPTVEIEMTTVEQANQGIGTEVMLGSGFETRLELVVDPKGVPISADASVRLSVYLATENSDIAETDSVDATGLLPLAGHEWRAHSPPLPS